VSTPRNAALRLLAVGVLIATGIISAGEASAASPHSAKITDGPVQHIDATHPLPKIGDRIASIAKGSTAPPTLATATEHGDVVAQRTGAVDPTTGASGVTSAASTVTSNVAIANCAALFRNEGTRTTRVDFCDIHNYGYDILSNNVVVGTVRWRQVAVGNTFVNDRGAYFETEFSNIVLTGTVDDGIVEDVLQTSGYSGADGTNVPCHVTDNPSNPTRLSQWQAGQTAFHEVWSDPSEGYSQDHVSRCPISTSILTESGYFGPIAKTETRADSASYFGTSALNGDVFDLVVPAFQLYSLSSTSNGEVAQHIWDAISQPATTWPIFADKMMPGVAERGRPTLHRLVDGWDADSTTRKAANETNKNAACTSWRAANPTVDVTGMDCDEFPFSSVWEGAGLDNHNFSVRYVDAAQNRSAGGTLGGWYNSDRILQRDLFYVDILP